MVRFSKSTAVFAGVALLMMVAVPAGAQVLYAPLNGFQEVPSVSTAGNGVARVRITSGGDAIEYLLVYMETKGAVASAHIHFGQPGVNGGVSAFLCAADAVEAPAGTPACPAPGKAVTGTLTAREIIGPEKQGIDHGEIRELVRAIRRHKAYVNVHTTAFPRGEIRGQIK